MRLVTYQAGDAGARPGLDDGRGNVWDLATVLRARGVAGQAPPDVRALIEGWDDWRKPVMAALEALAGGQATDPVGAHRLAAPIANPRRGAFAVAGNYRKHVEAAQETTGLQLTKRRGPVFFVKPTTTFAGPHDAIEYDPDFTTHLDYEVELAVVIGRGGRDIPAERALEHVFGYLVANDVSARDLMMANKPQVDYLRGKGLDTFMPMGPGLTPRELVPDPGDLALSLWVNGELRQSSTTAEMVRGVPEVIAELSRSLTLVAGDVIATGTPHGVAIEMAEPRWLTDGDVVEAEVAALGRLRNPVKARRD